MWWKFTEQARKVIYLAQEEAKSLGSILVEPEHILYGILSEQECSGAKVLVNIGVKIESKLEAFRANLPHQEMDISEAMSLSERSRSIIKWAYNVAGELGNNYIGTEHLLLGIIWEDKSRFSKHFPECDVTSETLRAAVNVLPKVKMSPLAQFIKKLPHRER